MDYDYASIRSPSRLDWFLHLVMTLPPRLLGSFAVGAFLVSHHVHSILQWKVRPLAFARMRKLLATFAASMQLAVIRGYALRSIWSMLCQLHLPIFLDAWYMRWILRWLRMLRRLQRSHPQSLHNPVTL